MKNHLAVRTLLPKPRLSSLALLLLLLAVGPVTFASPIYDITIDTNSVTSLAGDLYMQFQPGLNADLASVTVNNYATDGTPLAITPLVDGDVSPANPDLTLGAVTIGNTQALNDFAQFLTFGSSISFQVTFNLPASLSGQSGSAFNFEIDTIDTTSPYVPISTPISGSISYDQNGLFTADTLGNGTVLTITQIATPAVPEVGNAGSLILLIGLAAFGLFRARVPRSLALRS